MSAMRVAPTAKCARVTAKKRDEMISFGTEAASATPI